MVAKKRVNRGFHVPVIPKAPRSYGRRSAFKKKSDLNQSCAIELLAAVAGKLLLENESSSASSNERETSGQSGYNIRPMNQDNHNDEELFTARALDRISAHVPQMVKDTLEHDPIQHLQPESALLSHEASVVSNCDCSVNTVINLKSSILEGLEPSSTLVRKGEDHSHNCWESTEATARCGFVKHIGFEEDKTADVVNNITAMSKTLLGSCVKSASLTNSICSPSSKGCSCGTSSLKRRIFSLGSRDDDENISRFSQHSTRVKAYRPIPRRRGKKFLASKYKKVSPAWKDYKCINAVRGSWPVCQNRKTYSGREKLKISMRKRKLYDQTSVLTSHRGISDESLCNVPEKRMKRSMSCSARLGSDANGASSSPKGYKSSFSSKDSHVRLSIKSFKVPEIYIEVPENATVGLLKRKVLEAVTSLIGGGVHLDIRLRGKKIRDDSKSLLQTGISTKDNVGTLGFDLVPDSAEAPLFEAPMAMCLESVDGAPFLASDDSVHQLARSPISPVTPSASFVACNLIHDDLSKSNHDVVIAPAPAPAPAPSNSLSDSELNSKAIIPYTEMNVKALNAVPVDQKAKRAEAAHRRTRRPFSVSEVEALVESVEKLGTGRWRDVKLCAFETADHRTYVDLKDKWKTLVHTAQIAPQQRRGQQVPQELLDRVLAAHAYWSQHHAKQIRKNPDATAPPIATEVA